MIEQYTLFKLEEAETMAALLKESDDDWDYTPVHDPNKTGLSFINVYDEDHNLVGRV